MSFVKNVNKKIIYRVDKEKKYIVIESYIKRILIHMKYYCKQHTSKSEFCLQKLQKLRRLMT